MSEWDLNCQWFVAISKLVCGSVKWWDQVESSLVKEMTKMAVWEEEMEKEEQEVKNENLCGKYFVQSAINLTKILLPSFYTIQHI